MSLDDIVAADRAKNGGKGGKAKKPKGGRAAPYDKPKKEPKNEPKREKKEKKEKEEPKEIVPSKSVYVGNLAFSTEAAALEAHMKSAAPCTADVKTRLDKKKGESRPAGFAIVTFDDVEAATKAIETLHDSELDGRKLIVRFDSKGGEA